MSRLEENRIPVGGIFASCKGELETDNDSWDKYTLSEQIQCCIDQYKPSKEYCLEECSKNGVEIFSDGGALTDEQALIKCKLICDQSYDLGVDTCRLLSPEFQLNSTAYNSAIKFCPAQEHLLPDPECVRKNKDNIINTCRTSCIPTHNIDCQKYCDFMYNILSDTSKGKSFLGVSPKRDIEFPQKSGNNRGIGKKWIIIPIIIIICIILLGIYIFKK